MKIVPVILSVILSVILLATVAEADPTSAPKGRTSAETAPKSHPRKPNVPQTKNKALTCLDQNNEGSDPSNTGDDASDPNSPDYLPSNLLEENFDLDDFIDTAVATALVLTPIFIGNLVVCWIESGDMLSLIAYPIVVSTFGLIGGLTAKSVN